MATIREQIRSNAVALISLTVALLSLGYNTWRNETTEAQRNVRHASFSVLENLGELQEIVNYQFYFLRNEADQMREDELRVEGYGHALLIRDLMNLMPTPAPESGQALLALWNQQVDELSSQATKEMATQAEKELSAAIEHSRNAIVAVLKSLE